MLQRVEHISNLGPITLLCRDPDGPSADFGRLTLIFARNGRGKSTIAHLLRCLQRGDSSLAEGRRRLGSAKQPAAVLHVAGADVALGTAAWQARPLRLHVFDETFVHENVIDGLDNLPEHGRRILPLVIGEDGVALVRTSDGLAKMISQLSERRGELESEIRLHAPGADPTTICALEPSGSVDTQIKEAERMLQAQEGAARIAAQLAFSLVPLRNPSLICIESILSATVRTISKRARSEVQRRVSELGPTAEPWIRTGLGFSTPHCPFCEQSTGGLEIIDHYAAYFSTAYDDHMRGIVQARNLFASAFGPDVQRETIAAVVREETKRVFWAEFFPALGGVHLDAQGLESTWTAARQAIDNALSEKLARPLDSIALSTLARASVGQFVERCNAMWALLGTLQNTNADIDATKTRTAVGSVATARAAFTTAQNRKARHTPPLSATCDELVSVDRELAEKRAAKETAKRAIHEHNSRVFTDYERKINDNLERFQVAPRIVAFRGAIDTAGKGSSDFKIGVEGTSIPAGRYSETEPCMGSILSSGDRTALALAFFLAQFAGSAKVAESCIVFDDPISSFDRHRQDMTRDAILLLAKTAKQVIVLSHHPDFLADVWSKAHEEMPATTLTLERIPKKGHRLLPWDAAVETLGTFHRLRRLLRAYVSKESDDSSAAALAVCPFLEAYVRVVYPERLPQGKGKWLKHYLNSVTRELTANPRVIGARRLEELRQLVRFAGPHRHDADFFGLEPERDPDNIRAFAQLALQWVDPDRRAE